MAHPSPTTRHRIIRALDDLPPESLAAVAEFVEFLRAKADESPRGARSSRRVVKLGGLWRGYTFSEDDIRVARRSNRPAIK